jgi:hypothetical protein
MKFLGLSFLLLAGSVSSFASTALIINKDIQFSEKPNSQTYTWVHIREGKIDKQGFRMKVMGERYNSKGKPYCTLLVRLDGGLLSGDLVLSRGQNIDLSATQSKMNCYTHSDDGASAPSQQQIQTALGTLISFEK